MDPVVPDLRDVPCVPYIPMCSDLSTTVDTHRPLMNAQQKAWWEKTLEQMTREDQQQCRQCTSFRATMISNARNKRDKAEVATQKATAWRKAYKDMQRHLISRDPGAPHPVFNPPLVFPDFRLDRPDSQREISPEMKDMCTLPVVQKIAQLQVEGVECHFVGPQSAANKRSLHSSEKDIEVGQFCVVRGAVESDDEDAPLSNRIPAAPWWVGIITAIEFTTGKDHTVSTVSVHQCSNAKHIVSTATAKHLRWFQNAETDQDMFLPHNNRRPEKGFEPVVTEILAEALVQWGVKDTILTSSNTVKHAVLQALSENERVVWQMPDTQ